MPASSSVSLPYFFFYYVSKMDSDNEIFSDKTIEIQRLVWNFKDGDCQQPIIDMVKEKILHDCGDVSDFVFLCCPCSNDDNYHLRYSYISENLCHDLHLISAMNFVNSGSIKQITNPNFFENKKVIVFSDLICTGKTMDETIKSLKNMSADVVCCLSLARMYDKLEDGYNPYHPWLGSSLRDDSDFSGNEINSLELCFDRESENPSDFSFFDTDEIVDSPFDFSLKPENKTYTLNNFFDSESYDQRGTEHKFGSYNGSPLEWVVIANTDEYALLITKYAVDCRPYNDENCLTTWETCSLRRWLNTSFYEQTFSETEKENILKMRIIPEITKGHELNPGNETVDKVQILSANEYRKLFDYNHPWECRVLPSFKLRQCWLRNYGIDRKHAAFIGRSGSIHEGGSFVYSSRNAVRPVIWIRK